MEQLERELEAARLAIAALQAVATDEEFRAVETALDAIGAMSDTAAAALRELRLVRSQRGAPPGEGDEVRRAIEVRVAMPDERREPIGTGLP